MFRVYGVSLFLFVIFHCPMLSVATGIALLDDFLLEGNEID